MGMLQTDEQRESRVAKCDRCGDLGLWMAPNGDVLPCPVIQMRKPHAEVNLAAQIVARSIEVLKAKKRPVHHVEFDVARCLTHFTCDMPCDRELLLRNYFGWQGSTSGNLRRFHHVIEDLRKEWLLPVASRKDGGYWISTDVDDFQEWVREATSAPKTQLTTVHRLAKAHFPLFAGQLELEFADALKEAA